MTSIFLLEKIQSGLLYLIIFLIPWHTAYIISSGSISPLMSGDGVSTISQYLKISVTPLDVLFLVTFLISIPLLIQKRLTFSLPRICSAALVIFFAIASLSLYSGNQNLFVTVLYLFHLAEGIILFLLLHASRINVRHVGIIFVCAGVAQSMFALWQFFFQEISPSSLLGIAAHSAATLGDAVVEGGTFRILRAYGSFPHPNVLAGFLGVSLAWGIYMICIAKTKRSHFFYTIGSLCMLLGFLLTFSRGAAIAFGTAIILSILLRFFHSKRNGIATSSDSNRSPRNDIPDVRNGKQLPTRQFFLLSCILVGIFVFAFREPLMVRLGLQEGARLETRSVTERTLYIRQAFDMIASHPFGVGIGQYVPTLIKDDMDVGSLKPAYVYQPVHNLFLLIFAELGYQGLIVFLLFLATIFFHVWKRWQSKGLDPTFLYCSSIIFIFLFVSALTDHYYWTLQSGIFLWWISLSLVSKTT